jgi:hypothetical protein
MFPLLRLHAANVRLSKGSLLLVKVGFCLVLCPSRCSPSSLPLSAASVVDI